MTDLSELTQLRLTIQALSEQIDTERKLFMESAKDLRAKLELTEKALSRRDGELQEARKATADLTADLSAREDILQETKREKAEAEKQRDELKAYMERIAGIEEKAHLQTIDERDKAEEALSQAYYLIKGESPHWSNLFGYEQALEDIDDAQRCLRAEIKQLEAKLSILLPEGLSEMTPEEVHAKAVRLTADGSWWSIVNIERNLDPGGIMIARYAVQTTETLIAAQCTLNRVLDELAALQRASQEQRDELKAKLDGRGL